MSENPRWPIGSIVLFVLAALIYPLLLMSFRDIAGSDPAGRGLSAAFGMMLGIALWLVLGLLLLLAVIKAGLPRPAVFAVLMLYPLSAAAAFAAAELSMTQNGWPILVIAVLPPLLAGYALGMRIPATARVLSRRPAGAMLGVAIAAISMAPLMVAYFESHPSAARQAQRAEELQSWQAARDREVTEARDREAADFARLNPDSSLRDYLDRLAPGDSRFREAVAGARLVKSRQTDVIALLREGKLLSLQELWRLDLAPTQDLCAAYNSALNAEAMKVERGRGAYLSLAMDLERQLQNIQWLTGAQCNLDEALSTLAANVRAVSDSERLDKFAATLASFRQAR
jgi:hypothetical protein